METRKQRIREVLDEFGVFCKAPYSKDDLLSQIEAIMGEYELSREKIADIIDNHMSFEEFTRQKAYWIAEAIVKAREVKNGS